MARVTKVVKGGKLMGFRCVAVVGNLNGVVGVGCDSGREVSTAVKRALVDARKNLVRVPMQGQTLPHEVRIRFKAAEVLMKPLTSAATSFKPLAEEATEAHSLSPVVRCTQLVPTLVEV